MENKFNIITARERSREKLASIKNICDIEHCSSPVHKNKKKCYLHKTIANKEANYE